MFLDAVAARGSRPQLQRTIRSGPRAGETFPVEVPSTVQVLTSFAGGQHGTHLLSFDSALERAGVVEIHGSEGTLVIPDPNMFTGRIAYVKPVGTITDADRGGQEWIEIEPVGALTGRGIGVVDMARAIAAGRPHVASGELGYHVLDVMLSAQDAAASGQTVAVESTVAPVSLLPTGFDPFERTLAS